jgi:hypothetical protein
MRNYLKQNLTPILIGFVLAWFIIYITNAILDTIIKITLIEN